MDTVRMLAELRAERDRIDEAILTIQRLVTGQGKRRGRPPKWMAAPSEPMATSSRKRKPFSAATKRKMAASQKRRWAERKKAAKS